MSKVSLVSQALLIKKKKNQSAKKKRSLAGYPHFADEANKHVAYQSMSSTDLHPALDLRRVSYEGVGYRHQDMCLLGKEIEDEQIKALSYWRSSKKHLIVTHYPWC